MADVTIELTPGGRQQFLDAADRYTNYLQNNAPAWSVERGEALHAKLAAAAGSVQIDSNDLAAFDEMFDLEYWGPQYAGDTTPDELRPAVAAIHDAYLRDHAPELSSPQEVLNAMWDGEDGRPWPTSWVLRRYAELSQKLGGVRAALHSESFVNLLQEDVRAAKSGQHGINSPDSPANRVDAIGYAKAVHERIMLTTETGMPKPEWWERDAVVAARQVDWSPLGGDLATGLLVGVDGDNPSTDTLRLSRSLALVGV